MPDDELTLVERRGFLSELSHGGLLAIAWHLEQGEDNGGITREALAAFLRYVAEQTGPQEEDTDA